MHPASTGRGIEQRQRQELSLRILVAWAAYLQVLFGVTAPCARLAAAFVFAKPWGPCSGAAGSTCMSHSGARRPADPASLAWPTGGPSEYFPSLLSGCCASARRGLL